MGAEKYMRKRVMDALKGMHPVAIETGSVAPGTPDINHIFGWLELKQIPDWPKMATTVVQLPTYTPYQRVWHRDRWRAGGLVQVLLRVDETWLLFDGDVAFEHLGKSTKEELLIKARKVWHPRLVDQELREACSSRS